MGMRTLVSLMLGLGLVTSSVSGDWLGTVESLLATGRPAAPPSSCDVRLLAMCRVDGRFGALIDHQGDAYVVDAGWESLDSEFKVAVVDSTGVVIAMKNPERPALVAVPWSWTKPQAAVEVVGERLDLHAALRLVARMTSTNLFCHHRCRGDVDAAGAAASTIEALQMLAGRAGAYVTPVEGFDASATIDPRLLSSDPLDGFDARLAQIDAEMGMTASPPPAEVPAPRRSTFFVSPKPRLPVVVSSAAAAGKPTFALQLTRVDANVAMDYISSETTLRLVAASALRDETFVEAEFMPPLAVAELMALAFDAHLSVVPSFPDMCLVAPYGIDDLVFEAEARASSELWGCFSLEVKDIDCRAVFAMLERPTGLNLNLEPTVSATVDVDLSCLAPIEMLRIVAAAAGLDVRATASPGTYDVTPAWPRR